VAELLVGRDFVGVKGPDAATFLQGQLSQDIAALAPGGSAWSFVLQPQGKVDAFVRVLRVSEDQFVLDTEPGFGESLRARLQRFRLRVKAELEPLEWCCVARQPMPPGTPAPVVLHPVVSFLWTETVLPCADVTPSASSIPELLALYERDRILSGWPAMGSELTDNTIPGESGVLDEAVSFTKGCYVGQELVARIDSRGGHVPRHLRRLTPPSSGIVLEPGARVFAGDGEGHDVGWVTSSVPGVALGYVGRTVESPARVRVGEVNGVEVAEARSAHPA